MTKPLKATSRPPLTRESLMAGAAVAELLRPGTRIKIALVLSPDEVEGGYTVEVPALPGCVTEGDTLEEAIANAREAVACYLGEPAPKSLPKGAFPVEIEL